MDFARNLSFLILFLPFFSFSIDSPIYELMECDEGNGLADFNLLELQDTILSNIPGSGIFWFEDVNADMPIINPTEFSTFTSIIYARVTNDSNPYPGGDPIEVQLRVLDLPEVEINGDYKICNYETSTLSAEIFLGSGGYSYEWQIPPYSPDNIPETSSIVVNPNAAGNIILAVTDLNGCVGKDSVTLEVSYIIESFCMIDTLASTPSSSDGVILVNIASGGIPDFVIDVVGDNGYEDEINEAISGGVPIPDLPAGNYSITISDSFDCIGECNIFLDTCDLKIDIVNSLVTNPACFGDETGEINVETIGGIDNLSYEWSNSGLEDASILSELGAGIYTVTVTDQLGCQAIQTFEITQPDPLVVVCIATNPANENLENGSIELDILGGTGTCEIDWGSGNINDVASNHTIDNLGNGIYNITITDENGCDTTIIKELEGPACTLEVSSQSTHILCEGESTGEINLNIQGAIGDVTINWDDDTFDGMAEVNGLPAGTYSVTVTDTIQCNIDLIIEITEPSLLVVNCINPMATTTIGGMEGSFDVEILGGTGPFDIEYSGPISGDSIDVAQGVTTISGLAAGTYSVHIIDANGCEANCVNGLVNINEPECQDFEINIQEIKSVSCFGDSDGAFTFNLTDGAFTIIDSIKVLENGMLMDPTPSIVESEPDTFRINGLVAGIYSVSITDDRGCIANIDFTIDQPDLLLVQGCMPIMDGENISLTIVGGNGGYSYSITNEIGDIYQIGGTGTSLNLSNLQIGINTVTVTDTLGCTISCVIPVSDEDCLLEINITGNDVSCAGENDGSAAVVITQAGTPPYIFEWSNGDTTSSLNNISAGSYSVTVTESDNPDCRDTASITIDVEVEEPPFLIVNNIEFFCPGDILFINVVGGYDSYIWSTGEVSSSIIVNESGFYGVTVTDGDCSFNDLIQVIEVDISNLPLADAGPDAIIRENFYVLGGNDVQGIDDMVWTSNNDEIDFGDSTAFDSDVYNLDYCDNTFIWTLSTEQCTYSSDDVTIYNIEDSEVSVVNDTFFMINDGTVLDTVFNSGGIIDIQDLGLIELEPPKHEINFELNEDESFTYQPEEDFIGIDSFKYQIFDTECEIISDSGTVYIFVNPPDEVNSCSNLFFSPNGDGINDILIFNDLENNQYPNNRVLIFDQRGVTLISFSPYNNDWDGSYNGTRLPDGTYFYFLWFDNQGEIPCQGHISLLKNN